MAATAVVVWLAGGDDNRQTAEVGVPTEASVEDLRDFAIERGNPVFWGARTNWTKLELTETSRGHVFVRYLPESTPIGDDKPQFTTVATYPQPNALSRVRRPGTRQGVVTRKLGGGGLAAWSRS